MKRIIFIYILSLIASIYTVEAQDKKGKKKVSHYKVSSYHPDVKKSDQNKIRKQTRRLEAGSYQSSEAKYYKRQEVQEARFHKIRHKRAVEDKYIAYERKNKANRNRSHVDPNAKGKEFGTRKSRKKFMNLGPQKYNLNNVQEKPLSKSKRGSKKRK